MVLDRVCILGHSGAGKSPLSVLFSGASFEPRRKRRPRNAADYVISDSNFAAERQSHLATNASFTDRDPGGDWEVEVHPDVTFLKVRGKDQLLEHRDPTPASPLRVEIYAPVLDSLLKNFSSLSANLADRLHPARTVVLVLNPLATSFAALSAVTTELTAAVLGATAERARVQGKPVDLSDTLSRIASLQVELPAWQSVLANTSLTAVECVSWPHFEYRYYLPDGTLQNALAELRRTRQSVTLAIRTVAASALSDVEAMMLPDDQLARLMQVI